MRQALSLLLKLTLGIALAVGLIVSPLSARAAHASTIPAQDYLIPSGADPWGTAFDSQGNVWVAVPGCDPSPDCSTTTPGRIEEFRPSTQSWIGDYQLPAGYGQAIFLAIDSSGNIWFPMFSTDTLGMFNPTTHTFTQWTVPTPDSGPWDIDIDHNGNIWFTEHYVNQIGEFNPATQTFTEVATPTADSQPYGITVDSENNIWFTENNPSVALIAEYTSAGQLQEFKIRNSLPGSRLTPHLITVAPNGNIWWTEGWVGMIGELNPALASPGTTNGVSEYEYPTICGSCGTHASGISIDSSGTVWFDDSLQNMFGSYSPSTGSFSVSATPTAYGHPHDGMNVDGAGNVWFDEEFAGKLAESGPSVPTPPTATPGPLISQDTFQRPDQTYWGTASDGNAWGSDAATNDAFTISGNTAVVTNPDAILTGVLGASASDEQVVATGSTSSFSGSDYGVVLRYTNGANWYKAYIDGSNLVIRRDLDGNNAVVNSVPFAAAAGTPYTLMFQAVGKWLLAKVWVAGTSEPTSWMLVTSDSSLTAGEAGLQVHGSATFTYTSFAANTLTTTEGSLLAQDTFQRANQSFWGTASDGLPWGASANSSSVFSIANNAGQIANGNTGYNATLGSTATNSQVLLTGSMNSFTKANFGPVLHFQNANHWYRAYLDGSKLIIQKRVGTLATKLSSVAFPATGGTSYSIRFQIVGSTLSAKAWAAGTTEPSNWMATATDSTIAAGQCGIHAVVAKGSVASFTSFTATSL